MRASVLTMMPQSALLFPDAELEFSLRELARLVEGAVEGGDSWDEFDAHARLGPLWALRSNRPTAPCHATYGPMLCVIAQGAKQIFIGERSLVYDEGRFLINSVAVPASGQVIRATPDAPCLWIMLELDAALIAEVIAQTRPARAATPTLPAMEVSHVAPDLLDAVTRLARLLEAPRDADFLMPMLLREIVYRLLNGSQAAWLHQIAAQSGASKPVMKAIAWLRENFDQPLSIRALAREAGLSVSALHQGFKAVTAQTPLQFQKQMRLQEAHRLMLREGLAATRAGQRVGYDDAAYFNRDYRRFFGEPPLRHVARVRGEVG